MIKTILQKLRFKIKQVLCNHHRYYAVGETFETMSNGHMKKRYEMKCMDCGKVWLK